MLFDWNDRTAAWLEAASDYTGYNRELTALLRPYIPAGGTLCDMGCGLGLADLALTDYVGHITCVDRSEYAVDYIRARASREGIANLTAVCADGPSYAGEWDVVMALFHGTVETVCEPYLSRARQRLLLVVHDTAEGTTGPKGYHVRKCSEREGTMAWLDAHGLRYTVSRHALEFGQPHKDFEDALAYTRTFSLNAPEELLRESVREKLTETGRSDWPYYTPKKRRFAIFAIEV